MGPDKARDWLSVNATGLAFNSLAAVKRSADGRTDPMVNVGAKEKGKFIPSSAELDRLYCDAMQATDLYIRQASLECHRSRSGHRTFGGRQCRIPRRIPIPAGLAFCSERAQRSVSRA